jgi:hypothetical protein
VPAAPPREPWGSYAILVVPFIATLWVPLYNRAEPTLLGFPFFYGWLFLWIPLCSALNGALYLVLRRRKGA